MTLTDDEVQLVRTAFYQGPSALIEAGMHPAHIRDFFDRDDVQVEVGLLKSELDMHDALKARAKFAVRRGMNRLVDPAMSVLALALAGPEYQRDPKTRTIMRDSKGRPLLVNAEPTKGQLEAAKEVVRGVGLHDFRISAEPGSDNNLELLFRKAEEPRTIDVTGLGLTDNARTIARERVRVAIARLAPKLPEARERFRQEFEDAVNGKKATKKKATKKKAAKKRVARKKSSLRRGTSG